MKTNRIENVAREAYRVAKQLEQRRSLYSFASPQITADDAVLNLLRPQDAQTILDVGCGHGELLLKLRRRYPNARLVGVDRSPDLIRTAKSKASAEGATVEFYTGDAQCLEFPPHSFDHLLSVHMLYHVPNILNALKEFARVLKPSGQVVITTNSTKTKPFLKSLVNLVTPLLKPSSLTSTTERFSFESGGKLICQWFDRVESLEYLSEIRLQEPEPFLDYFDSTKSLWSPEPSQETWKSAMTSVVEAVQKKMSVDTLLVEPNVFGAFLATAPKQVD